MQPTDKAKDAEAQALFRSYLKNCNLKDALSKPPTRTMGQIINLPDPKPTGVSEEPVLEEWMKPIYERVLKRKQAQESASQGYTLLFWRC